MTLAAPLAETSNRARVAHVGEPVKFTKLEIETFINNYALDPVDDGAAERLRVFLFNNADTEDGICCEIAGRYFNQDEIDAVLYPDPDSPERLRWRPGARHIWRGKSIAATAPPPVPQYLVTLVAVVPRDVRSHGGRHEPGTDEEGDFCPCGNLMHHLAAHPHLVRIIDYAPLTIPHAPECPEQLSLHPLLAPTGPTSKGATS